MTSDSSALRVLIVDDVAADRELLTAELDRSGFQCRVDVAETLDEVRAKLEAGRYDFALADYRLKGWRGTDVITEIRRRGLNVPVILVTGTMGEEFADECLRAGASDFVLKHRMNRLPGAVRRALEEKRIKDEHADVLERNRRLSVAVDQSPAAVFITDPQGNIEYVNRRLTEITGYTPEDAIGQTPRLFQSGKTPDEVYEKLWDTITRGGAWRSELLNRRKNGELYWSQVSISPIRDGEGRITHFVAVHEDISERKWAEDAIREREERFRQIADNINEVFFVVAADFHEALFISPAYEQVWGRSCRSVYEDPSSFMKAVHPDDRPHLIANITTTRAGEDAGNVDFRVVHADGTIRWVRGHAAPVRDASGNVYRISGVALDITDRKEAEERLRESEERFRSLADASFDVIVQSVDGVYTEVSPSLERVLGYTSSDVIGRSPLEFVAPESQEEVRRRIRDHVEGRYELVVLHKDGRRLRMEAAAKTIEMGGRQARITALRDVTEHHSLEEQLRQAQKLEAVGRLAGGVAHDFNNLLTVILTEIQLQRLAPEFDANSAFAASLAEIEQAARRAAGLTRQLLTFSRRDVAEPRLLDPAEVVDGLNKMLGRIIGEDVALEVVVGEGIGDVHIDRGHLEQVIVNLAVNARDAMPQGGQLRIEMHNATLDREYAERHSEVEPGEYVLISVSDTGIGMSREVQERIFEPFFTTKEAGKGTGLGLATSYGIVREAGGHFSVYSEAGLGTTMKVYLPRASSSDEPRLIEEYVVRSEAPIAATVLVVEDDEAVRRTAVRSLQALGCEVLEAQGGEAALQILTKSPDSIDLLFTDVIMPGLGGPELADKAKHIAPRVKVLFATGYTADIAFRLKLLREQANVLSKPYTVAELASKVRAALAG
jgi:two-component system cell cycle sensor histidine kinase/response regulator CckA